MDIGPDKQTEELLKASIAASERSRRVMFISQVFGLLVLIAAINSMVSDWSSVRRDVTRTARVLLWCINHPDGDANNQTTLAYGRYPHLFRQHNHSVPDAAVASPDAAVASSDAAVVSSDAAIASSDAAAAVAASGAIASAPHSPEQNDEEAIVRLLATACRNHQIKISEEQANQAAWLLVKRSWIDQDIDSMYGILDGLERESSYSVPVSFLGMRIDVNDLGSVAGVIHLVVLGWLYLALKREAELRKIMTEYACASAAYTYHNFFGEVIQTQESEPSGAGRVVYLIAGAVLTIAWTVAWNAIIGSNQANRTWYVLASAVVVPIAALYGILYHYRKKNSRSPTAVALASSVVMVPLAAFLLLTLIDRSMADDVALYYGHVVVHASQLELAVCCVNGAMTAMLYGVLMGMVPILGYTAGARTSDSGSPKHQSELPTDSTST